MKILYKNAQNTSKKLKNNYIHKLSFATKQNKNEIRFFTISFSKHLVQLRRKEQSALENRLKILESNLNSNKILEEYNKLEEIYDNMKRENNHQNFFKPKKRQKWFKEILRKLR